MGSICDDYTAAKVMIVGTVLLISLAPLLLFHSGECDAPLCYAGGVDDNDISAEYANWIWFYAIGFAQSVTAAVLLYVSTGGKVRNTDMFNMAVFIPFAYVTIMLLAAPVMHLNPGTCDLAVCYLGGPDVWEIQNGREDINAGNNMIVLTAMLLFQFVFVVASAHRACNIMRDIRSLELGHYCIGDGCTYEFCDRRYKHSSGGAADPAAG